jgi:hypothetical protein
MALVAGWPIIRFLTSSEPLDSTHLVLGAIIIPMIFLAVLGARILGKNQMRKAEELRRKVMEASRTEPSPLASSDGITLGHDVRIHLFRKLTRIVFPKAVVSKRLVLLLLVSSSVAWIGWILLFTVVLRLSLVFIITFSVIGICNSLIFLHWWLSMRNRHGA